MDGVLIDRSEILAASASSILQRAISNCLQLVTFDQISGLLIGSPRSRQLFTTGDIEQISGVLIDRSKVLAASAMLIQHPQAISNCLRLIRSLVFSSEILAASAMSRLKCASFCNVCYDQILHMQCTMG